MLDMSSRALNVETSKPRKVRYTLRRFADYFRHYWLTLVLTGVFIVITAWATVTAPDLIGQAVDCYLFPQPGTATCWYTEVDPDASNADRLAGLGGIVLILAGLYLTDAIFSGFAFYTLRVGGQNVIRDLQRDLFRQIQRLTMGYYSREEAGDVMSRVTNDVSTVQQTLNFSLLNVTRGLLIVVWIIIRMVQANAAYALISLAIVPVMLLTTSYFSNQARRAFRVARRELGSVNADLQEGISGAREVQAFAREDETFEEFQRVNQANRAANVRAAAFTSALRPVLEALGYVALAIVVVAGGIALLRGEQLLGATVSLGLIFAFINYVQRINQPLQQIAILWANVQSGIAGGERIFQFLEIEPDLSDAPDAIEMPAIEGDIRFNDVTAEYKPGEPVLKGLDLHAQPGQRIAIVGPTGAGKTTLVNLIPRFYDATGGSIVIDGHDVRAVTRDSLRRQIGIVLQDTFLFSTTVMENIRYGRIDASDEEVIEAAKRVAAHQFIERLPEGYQTVLGERGGGLSQGQRQLIAIARVALMNPRVLILDEATSSVDTRTERVIQAAFEQLLAGRTSFVIAHRLSTIRNADQVLMLRAGEIIERGTHDELLAQRGAYYELYQSQFAEQAADA